MKRTLLALGLSLAAGLGAHFAWFATHRPSPVDDFDSQLRWMQEDLRLDDAQLARIRTLHEQANRRMGELAGQVTELRRELAAFEAARRDGSTIDFLAFARFIDRQRDIDRACVDSTRQLVEATAGVLTVEQRAHYLGMLTPALRESGGDLLN